MHVLLVDDDGLVRVSIAEMLERAAVDVGEADGGDAAIAWIEARGPPTIVVSDVNLGDEMDGLALSAVIRSRWPSVPVLLISGRDHSATGRSLGPGEGFLLKPFSLQMLLQNIGVLTCSAQA